MRKWLKRLVDYCFGEYLQNLKDIRYELIQIRSLLTMERKFPEFVETPARLSVVRPLQPLSKGGSIFNAQDDKL